MPMPPYPVICLTPNCGRPAIFKIASNWNDRFTAELKTYALTCEFCLRTAFLAAKERQMRCRLTHDEQLFPPKIFRIPEDQAERNLRHEPTLEDACLVMLNSAAG